MSSNVNHPSHYNIGRYEVIDVVEDWGLGEGFNRGNAIKYIARAGKKNPDKEIEDLEKARWYIDREIARLKKAKTFSQPMERYFKAGEIDAILNKKEERIWENGVEIGG